MVVDIVGQRGNQSFSPNPARIDAGGLVTWRNGDTVVHRIVLNDGSFDSGDIAPGATSRAMRLNGSGGAYHCTIHPTTMSGSLNEATVTPAPSPGPAY